MIGLLDAPAWLEGEQLSSLPAEYDPCYEKRQARDVYTIFLGV